MICWPCDKVIKSVNMTNSLHDSGKDFPIWKKKYIYIYVNYQEKDRSFMLTCQFFRLSSKRTLFSKVLLRSLTISSRVQAFLYKIVANYL